MSAKSNGGASSPLRKCQVLRFNFMASRWREVEDEALRCLVRKSNASQKLISNFSRKDGGAGARHRRIWPVTGSANTMLRSGVAERSCGSC